MSKTLLTSVWCHGTKQATANKTGVIVDWTWTIKSHDIPASRMLGGSSTKSPHPSRARSKKQNASWKTNTGKMVDCKKITLDCTSMKAVKVATHKVATHLLQNQVKGSGSSWSNVRTTWRVWLKFNDHSQIGVNWEKANLPMWGWRRGYWSGWIGRNPIYTEGKMWCHGKIMLTSAWCHETKQAADNRNKAGACQ